MSGYTVKVRGGGGYESREFSCTEHGVFDALIQRGLREPQPCPVCQADSEMVISAPIGRVKLGEVTRGKVEVAPTPYAYDTQPLADGMPYSEWKKRRRQLWADKDRADRRKEHS